jgi:hypothetical protein
MAQQTTSAARVLDPILTTVARALRAQGNFVSDVLFPIVPVGQRAGRILSFNAEHFVLANTARAPGSNTKRVQFGYSSETFALLDYSLEGLVPIELLQEASAVPGLDLAQMALMKVKSLMAIEREKKAADLALTAASYAASNKITLAGNDQWNVVHADSDPFADIETGKEAIRTLIGVRPNVLTIGPKVKNALSIHPLVLARLRGGAGSDSTDRGPATLAELAKVFDIERVVEGQGVYHNGTAFVDIWGKFAHLAYTVPASMAEMGTPSFGYTYQLRGYPIAEEPYRERNQKSWIYPYTDAYAPVLAGASAGYLITAAVA